MYRLGRGACLCRLWLLDWFLGGSLNGLDRVILLFGAYYTWCIFIIRLGLALGRCQLRDTKINTQFIITHLSLSLSLLAPMARKLVLQLFEHTSAHKRHIYPGFSKWTSCKRTKHSDEEKQKGALADSDEIRSTLGSSQLSSSPTIEARDATRFISGSERHVLTHFNPIRSTVDRATGSLFVVLRPTGGASKNRRLGYIPPRENIHWYLLGWQCIDRSAVCQEGGMPARSSSRNSRSSSCEATVLLWNHGIEKTWKSWKYEA